jgi:hypothetical protein
MTLSLHHVAVMSFIEFGKSGEGGAASLPEDWDSAVNKLGEICHN